MRKPHTPEEIRAKLIACVLLFPADALLLIAFVQYMTNGTVNMSCLVGTVMLVITYFFVPLPRKFIHQDFRIVDGCWFRNEDGNNLQEPDVKITFLFDDTSLIENCPFLCKITVLPEGQVKEKYAGIVYGRYSEISQLKSWTTRFQNRWE